MQALFAARLLDRIGTGTRSAPRDALVASSVAEQDRGKAFGLAGGLNLAPSPLDHADSIGELFWGGVAGTQWWISPKRNMAGVMMASP